MPTFGVELVTQLHIWVSWYILFVHVQRKLRHVLVALKPLKGSHRGELIAGSFEEVLHEWDLSVNVWKVFKILIDKDQT